MATTNTTLPIWNRGSLVPVMRYGNFSGQGYAGSLGPETLIEHPDINKGQPILVATLTQTPEGLASFMKVALRTAPNGYLDTVTRNHDVEYTVAEMRFMTSVQDKFGKLPFEMTAQDRQDPAFRQLETARDSEYWQADKRMLTSLVQYKPADFVDSTYRESLVSAFYVKAESATFGYGRGEEVNAFFEKLKEVDSSITIPGTGQLMDTWGQANALARGDFEALATLPLTPQERQFFNPHLKPGDRIDASTSHADGSPITYDEKDSTHRIVVPERLADGRFAVRTQMNGDTVTMILDKSDKDHPVFTKETVHNGQVVSVETIRATDVVDAGSVAARSYESVKTDAAGHVLEVREIAKPEVPRADISDDLQQKIDAVRSGDVQQILSIPASHGTDDIHSSTNDNDDFGGGLVDAFTNPPPINKDRDIQLADASDGSTVSDAGGGGDNSTSTNAKPPTLTEEQAQKQEQALFNAKANDAAATLNLINSLAALQFFDHLSDAGKLQSLVSLYNQLDSLGSATAALQGQGVAGNLPGDLGQWGAGLNLVCALEGSNPIAQASAAASLYNSLANEVGSGLNAIPVPYLQALNLAGALQSGNPVSIAASAVAFIPGWGTAASIAISIIGPLLSDNRPPPPVGVVHFEWRADGSIHTQVDQNISDGAKAAQSAAAGVQSLLDQVVQAINDRTPEASDNMAINPYLLPRVGFSDGHAWLEVTNPDGSTSQHSLEQEGLVQTLVQMLTDNGGIAPQWQVQTQMAHMQQLLAHGAGQGEIAAELGAGKGGTGGELGSAQVHTAAYALQGNAAESADFKSQSFGALVVHQHENPQVQKAQAELSVTLTNVLRDADNDGYLEATQSVAAMDARGHAQGTLVLDFNGNGLIETRDILNLGGNTAEAGNHSDTAQLASAHASLQRNNVQWLDANGDGVLDKSDPAFAAIKLWVDINQDGQMQAGEGRSLAQLSLVSIDFIHGRVSYADGHSDALTAATLQGSTEGVRATQLQVADDEGRLHTLDAGEMLEHEGYAGQVQVSDRDGTRWGQVRSATFEQQAKRIGDWEGTADQDAHRHGGGNVAVGGQAAPTRTTATGAVSTGAVQVAASPARTAETVQASDARVRSNERVVFVPVGAGDALAQFRQVTADMIRGAQDSVMGPGLGAGVGLGLLAATFAGASAAQVLAAQGRGPTGGVADGAGEEVGSTGWHSAGQPWRFVDLQDSTSAFAGSGGQPGFDPFAFALAGHGAAGGIAPGQTAGGLYADSVVPLVSLAGAVGAQAFGGVQTGLPTGFLGTSPGATSLLPQVEPVPQTAIGGVLMLDFPEVEGETLGGLEDQMSRIPSGVLLGNDASRNERADPDAHALAIIAVAQPVHGQVALVGSDVVFVPDPDFHGVASFSYVVSDQYGLTRTATATLQIGAVNDAPVTRGETGSADEDTGLVFTQAQLLRNDSDADVATDGQVLRVSQVGQALHGTVLLDAQGNVRFVPEPDYHGPAQFTYWVSDGAGAQTPATVNLRIAPVNDIPVARGETVDSDEDVTLLFAPAVLLANDSDADMATDGQVLQIAAVGNARHGTVSLRADGSVEFVPEADYFGPASFDYTVSDGQGGTATTTAVIRLANVNDAPVGVGESVDSVEDQVLTITAAALLQNDSDVDHAPSDLSISRVQAVTGGSVSLDAQGNVVFSPLANFNGTATFTYWVRDALGLESAPVTARVLVSAVNDAPYAQGETVSGAVEDAQFHIARGTLLANDGDVDDQPAALSLAWVGGATGGVVSLDATGDVVFVPDANFNGNASFSYRVADAAGLESPTVQVVIPVQAVNDAPLAVDDQFATYRNATMTIAFNQLTGNDKDADRDALSVSAVRDNSNGHASIVNGQVRFIATPGFTGQASFDYQVDDGHGGQTWATAFVEVVNPPNAYPEMQLTAIDFYGTQENAGLRIDIASAGFHPVDDGDAALASVSLLGVSVLRRDLSRPVETVVTQGPETQYIVTDYPYYTWQGLAGVNGFTWSGSGLYLDVVRWYGFTAFRSSWQVVDDHGLANVWHLDYDINTGAHTYSDHTGYASPIVLALGDGPAAFVSRYYSQVRYDVNGDGLADTPAWAAAGSGVLGIDLNGDNRITDATEFAFRRYVAGAQTDMEGLAAFDTNQDGKLDRQDAQWVKFGVWEDRNGDGVTQEGEYLSLAQRGIASIDLHTNAQVHNAGPEGASADVVVMGTGSYTRNDGSTGSTLDAMFAYQPATMASAGNGSAAHDCALADQASVMRAALLFSQDSNTASGSNALPLGFAPVVTEEQQIDHLLASQIAAQVECRVA